LSTPKYKKSIEKRRKILEGKTNKGKKMTKKERWKSISLLYSIK